MMNIVVCGAAGKMGKMIISRVIADPEVKFSGAVEAKGNPCVGSDSSGITITDDFEKAIKTADVAIDFTSPDATINHVELAAKNKKAMVIGTTGLTPGAVEKIKSAAGVIPVVFSPNMSVGVNLLFKLVEEVAGVLADYDVEIVEAHHNQKKDAPSGTAAKLADIIAKKLELPLVYGRQGIVGARKKEIGIHAVRAGDIVGEHTVLFAGPGERVELIHRAHSRETFAAGAVRAAKWLNGKKPGLYTMRDVLGL
jgi:4-hydroxy-tetrahydrodipicolinate reductase